MSALLDALVDEAGLAAVGGRLLRAGAPFAQRPFHAALPSFRSYDGDELGPHPASGRFPAFSITGDACALDCRHCRAKILAPMISAQDPARFEARARAMISRGMRGFLLSGGSNRRNEVPFDRYLPVIARLKRDHPELSVLAHTGLVDAARAAALKEAGVDVAMLDVIGDDDTIREVYHLERPVADFEASLRHLVEAGLTVVPHVVVGLHFGRLRGEARALDMIARSPTQAAILVVVMPAFADPEFTPVDPQEAALLFAQARETLADRLVLLGCARPHGAPRIALDVAAVLAGFDGIAFPCDAAVRAAHALGRPLRQDGACCAKACAA